jgi:hypothetical protein
MINFLNKNKNEKCIFLVFIKQVYHGAWSRECKMQLLQDPNQSNVLNINNIRHRTIKTFLEQNEEISQTCGGASVTLSSFTSLKPMG